MIIGLGIGIPFRKNRVQQAIAEWSPSSLFANNEQGAWYDPSDTSTLFQNAAGTLPVTAVEQPVGLMLDKSKGLVLGSELVTNGTFDSDTAWTKSAASVTISGGSINFSSSTGYAQQSNAAWNGLYVELTIVVSSLLSGAVYLTWDGGVSTPNITSPGTYTYRRRNASNNFYIFTSGTTTATVDSVSMKAVLGNHAYQATSISRPTLSARYNLLRQTEQFDDAVWQKTRTDVTANTTIAPDGFQTADTIIPNTINSLHYVSGQTISVVSGTSYTSTIYAKAKEISKLDVTCSTNLGAATFDLVAQTATLIIGSSASITPVGNGWFKCSVTRTAPANSTESMWVLLWNAAGTAVAFAGNGTDGIYIWGADLRVSNDGVNLPAYQRVGNVSVTPSDYDTEGFPKYLRFDGIDDFLQTNSINFTATDKMFVSAGVRKLSDAAIGAISELSADANSNVGSFNILAPDTNGLNSYQVGLRGNSTISAYRLTTFVAPVTNVISSTFNISGSGVANEISPRVNGAIPTLTSIGGADSGTGNFGNYPLYIGRRAGTSLPFNGRIYSLIVRGAQSSDAQITATETYVNNLTKAYA